MLSPPPCWGERRPAGAVRVLSDIAILPNVMISLRLADRLPTRYIRPDSCSHCSLFVLLIIWIACRRREVHTEDGADYDKWWEYQKDGKGSVTYPLAGFWSCHVTSYRICSNKSVLTLQFVLFVKLGWSNGEGHTCRIHRDVINIYLQNFARKRWETWKN